MRTVFLSLAAICVMALVSLATHASAAALDNPLMLEPITAAADPTAGPTAFPTFDTDPVVIQAIADTSDAILGICPEVGGRTPGDVAALFEAADACFDSKFESGSPTHARDPVPK